MLRYKVYIDLSDMHRELSDFVLAGFSGGPFGIIFIEAENPDEACVTVLTRIMRSIIGTRDTIENRILCRKVRRTIRYDRIMEI